VRPPWWFLPGNETHLHAFETRFTGPDGEAGASICIPHRNSRKEIAGGGEKRIFDFAALFPKPERGRLHALNLRCWSGTVRCEDYQAVIADSLVVIPAGGGYRRGGPVPSSRSGVRIPVPKRID